MLKSRPMPATCDAARWRLIAAYPWQSAAVLAILFASLRVTGALGPAQWRWLLPTGFILMAATPFVLLNAAGRRRMGLTLSAGPRAYVAGVLSGCAAAFVCFLLGFALFGAGPDNWFVSIANSYRQAAHTTGWSLVQLHLVFTLPAMLFSPIGEEVFFRGYLQDALEQRFSVEASTLAECAAFGVVHLCHHGVMLGGAGILIRPLSGLLWVLLMFATALLFAYLRKSTGSLLPAMASHASFNVIMNVAIFAFLWTGSAE